MPSNNPFIPYRFLVHKQQQNLLWVELLNAILSSLQQDFSQSNVRVADLITMDCVPVEIVLSISSYLLIDDLANFSLTCKSIREYTKGHRCIDISQIAYRHSRKDIISILKILRFHPFKIWILPADISLYEDPEVVHLVSNMMQSNFIKHEIKKNKAHFENWIRKKWSIGSVCEIYSNQNWIKGEIVDLSDQYLKIEYTQSDVVRIKEVLRNDEASVRPIPSSIVMYQYVYDAVYGKKTTEYSIKSKSIEFVYPLNISKVCSEWFNDDHPLIQSLSNIEIHHLKLNSVGHITGSCLNWQRL